MTETYTLRLSRQNPILPEAEFVAWLKEKGHIVSMSDAAYSTVNGIPDLHSDNPQSSWAREVFCELLDAFEYAQELAQQEPVS